MNYCFERDQSWQTCAALSRLGETTCWACPELKFDSSRLRKGEKSLTRIDRATHTKNRNHEEKFVNTNSRLAQDVKRDGSQGAHWQFRGDLDSGLESSVAEKRFESRAVAKCHGSLFGIVH